MSKIYAVLAISTVLTLAPPLIGDNQHRPLRSADANAARPPPLFSDGKVGGSIHVPTEAALLAADPKLHIVARDGFYVAGDGGSASYQHASAPCSISGGDGGSQVPAADGGCWMIRAKVGERINLAVWGASTNRTPDNGAPIDRAFAASHLIGPFDLRLGAGIFPLASTFDCHGASGTTFEGEGNQTQLHRTGNYGSTMTCSGVNSFRVANLWAIQDLGVDPTTLYGTATQLPHATTNMAHFDFSDSQHVTFDHITAWNANYNFRLERVIDATLDHPATSGYYDGTRNQTIASLIVDGADGVGMGHPQLIRVLFPQFGGDLLQHQPVTYRSGAASRTLTPTNSGGVTTGGQQVWLGPLDHVLIDSVEDFQWIGGIANDAFGSSLHIAPRGDPARPILKVAATGVFFDGAGRDGDVYIENGGVTTCVASAAADIQLVGNRFVGELVGTHAVSVPHAGPCPSAVAFQMTGNDFSAHVVTPVSLGGVRGGYLDGGSIRNYNALGLYVNDVAQSSAVYLFGITAYFVVSGVALGGGQNYEPIDTAHPPGTAPYAANQDEYGVSIQGGLLNVSRRNIADLGFFTDYAGAEPAIVCGTEGVNCSAQLGSDSMQGLVVTTASSGSVTVASVLFDAGVAATSIPHCHVTDALTSAGVPIAAAITRLTSKGIGVSFASSIGGGGSFRYECD